MLGIYTTRMHVSTLNNIDLYIHVYIIAIRLTVTLLYMYRLLTLAITAVVLTAIHYNSFLTLTTCALLFAGAAYLQTQLTQVYILYPILLVD